MRSGALPPPETLAQGFLVRAGQNQPPVDPCAVVDIWPGLRVSETALDGDAYLLSLGALGGEIVVAADRRRARRRFSISHELAHWVLQRELGVSAAGTDDWATHVEIERWCDRFAAALLMPADWLMDELRGCPPRELFGRLTAVAQLYDVSRAALHLRVSEVSGISLFELDYAAGVWNIEHSCLSMHADRNLPAGDLAQECLSGSGIVKRDRFVAVTELVRKTHSGLRAFLGVIPDKPVAERPY